MSLNYTKEQFVLRSLSKIKHKKWELYIITRIIHLLDDPTIEFSCQQLVKSKTGKRFLTDLCFPNLNLYYEIDEVQHSSLKHQISDKHRKREIVDTTNFIEKRIKVFTSNGQDRNIEDINKEVDKFIVFIKNRKRELINKNRFVPWDFKKKFDPKTYVDRGYIDLKDNVAFLTQRDCKRCFGYKGGHAQRASWKIPNKNKRLWFPKLYSDKDWNNFLSEDFKQIVMQRTSGNDLNLPVREDGNSIVFAHYQNIFGKKVYKFLGEYQRTLVSRKKWIFDRITIKVKL